jgi:autotransporter-associated beta strand protein
MKEKGLALKYSSKQLLFLAICLLGYSNVFAQKWNFYCTSSDLSTLANNLANGDLNLNTSSSNTVGGVVPIYGKGHIVFSSNFTYTSGNARTLTFTSTEDIWINGDITSTGAALNLAFIVPAGKRIMINGNITTNGGYFRVNHGTTVVSSVHFQKTSGSPVTQVINTSGGDISLNHSTLKLLNTGGSLVLNSGSGAISLGANGTIVQEGTKQNITVAKVLDSGGEHTYSNKSYTNMITSATLSAQSGKVYSGSLFFWDSWDGELGQIKVASNVYFQANNQWDQSTLSSVVLNNGTEYVLRDYSNFGEQNWTDKRIDFTFTAAHNGTIETYTSTEQNINDESLELKNVWETTFGTETFSIASRTIELITTNTTQDACLIAGVISGGLSLKKSGSGTVKLTNYNVFTGGTTVDAGILQLHDPAVAGNIGKGVIINVLTVNQNGTVQLSAAPGGSAAFGWWNGTNNDFRVRTLNINGGLVESTSGQQHIWFMDGGVNFNGGGTIQTNGGASNSTTSNYIEWSLTNVNVTNATSPAIISGRINLRNDAGSYEFTCNVADGSTDNDLLISAAITQAASINFKKTGTGKLTLGANNSYAGATSIDGGTLTLQNNAPDPTNKTFNGTGQLIIEPAGTSFTSAFSTTGWTFNSTLTGLTLGKSGNIADVTNALNQTINGPITVFGGNITMSENFISSSANQPISLRATGNIDVATSKTLRTNGGNIILWADSDASGAGGIRIDDNVTIDSRTATDRSANTNTIGGGRIVLAGGLDNGGTTSGTSSLTTGLTSGDGIPDGYAVNSGSLATQAGIVIGTSTTATGHDCSVSMLSGSGELRLHGLATNNTSNPNNGPTGIIAFEGYNLNSGTSGNIILLGNSSPVLPGNYTVGLDLAAWRTSTTTDNSVIRTSNGNISLIGRGSGGTSGNFGIAIDGDANRIIVAATGTGTITLDGLATETSPSDIRLTNVDLLAASGAINVIAKGTSGIGIATWNIGNGLFLGQKAGSLVTSSTSNVTLTTNALNTANQPLVVNSTGAFAIEPFASHFASTLTINSTQDIASTLTSLRLGKSGNSTAITVAHAKTINGPITIHGGDITLNAGLTTTNNSTGDVTFNSSKLLGAGAIALGTGRMLTTNLSGTGEYTGQISGTTISLNKTGAGTLTLNPTNTLTFSGVTVTTGGLTIAASKQLTVSGALTNNATFTLKDNATLVQATTGTGITGSGTYTVEKALTGNAATWTTANTSRFWYMGVPMISVLRSSFGNYDLNTNRLWSYSESTKSYTNITDNTPLSAGTGYVHRRSTDGTLTFSAAGTNGLYGSDLTLSGLTRTSGASVGFHLISNPYMAYLDWHAVTKTNVESTYYIRSNNAGNDISALITYNGSNQQLTHNTGLTLTAAQMQYIAPMQAIWVRVGPNTGTGSLAMTRSMLSHQTGNPGLKSSTIFPTLARVNLVDGPRFDQLLVFMNQDMSNAVDEYDSEKMFVSGNPQIYTMAAGKKLVMNGLNSNKKKISVPLYLDLPSSKVYELQLSEYILEDGIILLEDKQEGTIQDFTIHDTYAFYANSGVLSNRFVLHFFMPDATITAQGPSNSWVEDETSYTEGGSVQITADSKGKVQISLDQPETDKVEGTVQATDANGRVVYSGALEGLTTEFQLNVPSGIYYLTVQSGNMTENKKVFIQD